MKRFTHPIFRLSLTEMFSRSLLIVTIATTSSFAFNFFMSSKANAQNRSIDRNEVTNYSITLLRMEPIRQEAFNQIKRIVGGKQIPNIACNNSNSMKNIPRNAREIAINYCNRSQKIVEENGLTIERFNNITQQLSNDDQLKKNIYRELIRLQNDPNSR